MTSNLVIVGVQNRDVSENISLLVQIYTDGCRIDPHWPDVTWRRLMSWCVTIRAWCTKWGMGRRMQLCDLKPGLGKGKQTVKRKKSILLVFYLLVYSVYTVLEKRFWMENLVKKTRGKQFSTSLTQSEKKTLKDSWIEDPSSVRVNHSRHPSPINPLHLLKLDAWW